MKKILGFLLPVIMIVMLAGCGSSNNDTEVSENAINVYYKDTSMNKLTAEEYEIDPAASTETLVEDLKDRLSAPEDEHDCEPLLEDGVKILGTTLRDTNLTIDFNSDYLRMSDSREILARAGIVKTFVQAGDVKSVMFTIEGNPLLDSEGNEVGVMNVSTFIDNSGQDINSYEKDSVQLYYGNESGTGLVREDRVIYHPSGQSLEWAVVERLINGPRISGHTGTIPLNTEIVNVTTANGICYVNLSREFMDNTSSVSGRITIYSIVNSLVESCKVKQVQLSVEGEKMLTYKDNIALDTPFKEDLTLTEEQ